MGIDPKLLQQVVALRRDLHMYPELAFEEERTASKVLEAISVIPGLEIKSGIAVTGILATLKGDFDGPCVALRADMDALPIQEESNPEEGERAWLSRIPGKMHACGHDGHTASLVGAVHELARRHKEIHGTIKFIFQPAEEHIGGAQIMCQEGILKNPDVSAVFGAHVWPHEPFGTVCLTPGPAMAAVDDFYITVKGKGGHAAAPHITVDPIVIASQIVVAAQSLVARNVSPFQQAVISICKFEGGSATNVIPEYVKLAGTIRTYDKALREEIPKRLKSLAEGIAQGMGGGIEWQLRSSYPSVINDDNAYGVVKSAAEKFLPPDLINPNAAPSMGAEDFAYYLQKRPGMFWKFGSKRGPAEPQLHTSKYDFCDDLLPTVIQMHVQIALEALSFYSYKK
jgi:amidohydrolase